MTDPTPIKTILSVQSSARRTDSTTRDLSAEFIQRVKATTPDLQVIERDLYQGMPFVDEQWVDANFTPDTERTAEHTAILSFSDDLIAELEAADMLVLGAPIYNFSVPAILKAWIDQIARARRTFAYGPNGPIGLLKNKRAVIVAASGGVPVGAEVDFATGYLRHVMGFIGVDDVTLISADGQVRDRDEALARARAQIDETVKGLEAELETVG